MPPCHATLVGFRGLLLHQRYLRQASDAHDSAKMMHRYRPDADAVLMHGIYHSDILDKGGKIEGGASSAHGDADARAAASAEEERAADERLFQRFKALFFWPAVMSATK